jgi:hypothetical protein
LALVVLAFSAMNLWLDANVLNETNTSRSTVEVALGTAPSFICEPEPARVVPAVGRTGAGSLVSSVGAFEASALVSAVLPLAVDSAGLSATGVAGLSAVPEFFGSTVFGVGGFGVGVLFNCDEMIAGSTGAPLTVAWPVGARRAGGVYLFSRLVNGGKSCRRTPLYLERG